MNKPHVYLDLDGCLANWQKKVFDTFGVVNPTPVQLAEYDTWKCLDPKRFLTENDFWQYIEEQGDEWWATIEPFDHTQELWLLCNKLAPTCILSKTGPNPSAAAGKMKWMAKHLATKNFLLGRNKNFCAAPNALLIDDNDSNCKDFIDNGGKAFLWPAPYNTHKSMLVEDAMWRIRHRTLDWEVK